MKKLTKEKLAELLDGEPYIPINAITKIVFNNLVVIVEDGCGGPSVIGISNADIIPEYTDYALLLKGEKFTDDEDSKYRYVADRNMILPLSDEYNNDDHPRLIRVEKEPEGTDLSCRITSNIPHAEFTIKNSKLFDDDRAYSKGIVIDLDDIDPVK